MGADGMTRRGFLGVPLAGVAAWLGGRSLAGCGGPDVSVRIRRVDGQMQSDRVVVRASIVVTNHKNEPRTLPLQITLKDAAGAVIGSLDETVSVASAELLCRCLEVAVASYRAGATLTITLGTETVSSALGSFGSAALPSCEYTCNY